MVRSGGADTSILTWPQRHAPLIGSSNGVIAFPDAFFKYHAVNLPDFNGPVRCRSKAERARA